MVAVTREGRWPLDVLLGDHHGSPVLLGSFEIDESRSATPSQQAAAILEQVAHLYEEWRTTVGDPAWVDAMGPGFTAGEQWWEWTWTPS